MNPKPVTILPTMMDPSEDQQARCGAHRAWHDSLTGIEGRALVAQTSKGGQHRQET
jgi:hypothetical protein